MTINKNTNPESLDTKKNGNITPTHFIREFTEKVTHDKKTIDTIFKNDALTSELKLKIETELAHFKKKYPGFELDPDEIEKKISIRELRVHLAAPFLDMEKKRKELIDRLNYDYDFSETEAKQVDEQVQALDEKKLKRYIVNAGERTTFLKQIGMKNLERKTAGMTEFFKDILHRNRPSATKITDKDAKILTKILDKEGYLQQMNSPEIVQELFTLSFLKDEDKRSIVEKFMPTISLAEIEKYSIFGPTQTAKIVTKLEGEIKNTLLALDFVTDENIDSVMKALDRDELFVTTATVFSSYSSDLQIDKYVNTSQHFEEEVFDDFNNNISYLETKDSRFEFPNGYSDFEKKLSGLKNFGEVQKFKKGNYLTLDISRSVGTTGRKEQTTVFFKIADTGENNNFTVNLVDAGMGNIDFQSKTMFSVTYKNFISIFEEGLEIDDKHYAVTASTIYTGKEIKTGVVAEQFATTLNNSSKKAKNYRAEVDDMYENGLILGKNMRDFKNNNFPGGAALSLEIEQLKQELETTTDTTKRDAIEQEIGLKVKERNNLVAKQCEKYDSAFTADVPGEGNNKNVFELLANAHVRYEETPTPEIEEEIKNLTQLKDKLLNNMKQSERLPVEIEEEYFEKLMEMKVQQNKEYNTLIKFDYNFLLESIDEIDGEGRKFGLEKGTSFVTKGGATFTIANTPEIDQRIEIIDISKGNKEVTVVEDLEFFYEVFEEQNCKRLSKTIENKQEFLVALQEDTSTSDIFEKMEFVTVKGKDGDTRPRLTKTDTNENVYYDYIIAKSSNTLLEFLDFQEDGNVRIRFGEFDDGYEINKEGNEIATYTKEEAKALGKKAGDKKKKNTITYYENTERIVPYSWVLSWAKNQNAKPFTDSTSLDQKQEKDENNLKKSFLTGLLNSKNIPEMIAGLKLGVDMLGEYMKEGSDARSAQFAKSIYGKLLPEQVALDLQSKVEHKQKERCDQYISKLQQLETTDALNLLYKWIDTKNSPEYLKEAALLFVVQKYGYLNTKKSYGNNVGTYKWYTALGGTVNSKHFKDMMASCEKSGTYFTEEQLVYDLIEKQSKGELPPKRRGRLYKELNKLFEQGKNNEYEDGVKEGKAAKDIKEINTMMMGEIGGNVPDHARGLLEEAFNKGGSMKDLNKIPFIMAFSGMAYNFDTYTLNEFKKFPYKGMMTPILKFINIPSDLDLLNKTIVQVTKDIADASGDKAIYSQAKKIFSQQKEYAGKHKSYISEVEAFYESYGDEITRALYMLNTGDAGEKGYLGDLVATRKEEEPIYKEYYEKMHSFAGGAFNWTDTDMMKETLPGLGTTGISEEYSAKQIFLFNQQGFKNDYAQSYLDEFVNEIEAIKKRDYPLVEESRKMEVKANLISHKFENLLGAIISANASDERGQNVALLGINSPVADIGRNYGVDFGKMIGADHEMRPIVCKQYAKKVLSSERIENQRNYGKMEVGKLIDYSAANDDDYRVAA